MGRALGINAVVGGAFEAAYGTPPASGYTRLPLISHSLGETSELLDSDLIGYGREPLDPTYDVKNNRGDITVPVDLRAFGFWLKLLMGAPVTATGVAAIGSIAFNAQPAANSTVTINGVVVTFVVSGATGSQVNIGANTNATVAALQTYLAGVGSGNIFAATYAATGSTLNITHKTAGPGGNAFTLAASATSNGTVSGATLSGGTNTHTFTSGSTTLPSMSLEIGNPDVPSFSTHFGARADTIRISLARSGLLNAVVGLIAQGETALVPASTAGTLATLALTRFAQATGSIKRDGVELGSVVQADLMLSNSLDPVETIKSDSRILDSDPGVFDAKGSFTAKFTDRALSDVANNGLPVQLSYGWSFGNYSLIFTFPRVFLPKVKRPIEGPRGIQADYNWEASGAAGNSVTAVLSNDLAGSAYA